ncbi:MAG TPA: ComEC/Rec2 family competence protein, partial [Myxococcaceae bacterium]|nr:ComEC/Rec2 family competence protein [Myxococcaceae bacterium]
MERRLAWSQLGARPGVFPSLFFGLGVWFGGEPTVPAELFLAASALAAMCAVVRTPRTGDHLTLLGAFACAGMGLSALAARTEVPPTVSSGAATLEGVVGEMRDFGEYQRWVLAVSGVTAPERARARFGVRLYSHGRAPQLFPGQRVRVATRLRPVEPPLNPGQPDVRSRLLRSGIAYSGGFDPRAVVVLSEPGPVVRWMEDARQSLAARVRSTAPSSDAAALFLTLAAGLRAELSDEMEERFSASGLAHVLSVSGLHVAVLAVVLLWTIRWVLAVSWAVARRFDVRRIAAPLAVPLVWAYVVFTGNQLPAVRSAIMASAVLLAMALWRRPDPLNSLGLAAIAVLALDPPAIADLSSQLSFLAVAGLVLIAPAIRDLVPVRRPEPPHADGWSHLLARLREAALSTLCASAAVTLATAPLVASTFGRISLAGMISNVLCLPLCTALAVLA